MGGQSLERMNDQMQVFLVLLIMVAAILDLLAPQELKVDELNPSVAIESSFGSSGHCPLGLSGGSHSTNGHQHHGTCASNCHFGHCGILSAQLLTQASELEEAWTAQYQFFLPSPDLSGLRRPPKFAT